MATFGWIGSASRSRAGRLIADWLALSAIHVHVVRPRFFTVIAVAFSILHGEVAC